LGAISGEQQEWEEDGLGILQGSSENHEICEALFNALERRGLARSNRILFVSDGGGSLLKALRERFGKKLVHQRCAFHKRRNMQRHLANAYREEAYHKRIPALDQMYDANAKDMLLELESWLRTKNESVADPLLEAFEELLPLQRLNVPSRLRKTLRSTHLIGSIFSLVWHCERTINRTRAAVPAHSLE
jgi:transposase-like protein